MVRATILCATFMVCLFTIACKKELLTASETPSVKSALWDNFVKKHGSQIQDFAIDADKGGTVLTQGKTTFTVPAKAFTFENGETVTGNVTLSIQEFNSVSALILHGKQTMTADNQMLDSWGTFTISATQDGKTLKLQDGKAIKAAKKFVSYNGVPKDLVKNWIAQPYKNSIAWALLDDTRSSFTAATRDEGLEMLARVLQATYNWDYPMTGGVSASANVETTDRERLDNVSIYFVPSNSRSALSFFRSDNGYATTDAIQQGMGGIIIAVGTSGERLYATTQPSNTSNRYGLKLSPIDEEDLVRILNELDTRRE